MLVTAVITHQHIMFENFFIFYNQLIIHMLHNCVFSLKISGVLLKLKTRHVKLSFSNHFLSFKFAYL